MTGDTAKANDAMKATVISKFGRVLLVAGLGVCLMSIGPLAADMGAMGSVTPDRTRKPTKTMRPPRTAIGSPRPTRSPTPIPVTPGPCPGDCDGSFDVSISEITRGVAIVLGRLDVGHCPEFDTSGDGQLEVNELVGALGQAVHGCYHDLNQCGLPASALVEEIEWMIADQSCDDDEQCQRIGIGAKPCGGPWRVEYFSTKNTDPDELRRLVGIYNASDRMRNSRHRCLSTCDFVRRPPPVCLSGYCVASTP